MRRPVFHPPSLPLRAWLLTAAAALFLLLLQDGSLGDLFPLLLGFMPLEANGPGYLHILLGRSTATFCCISVAAILGWSTALALTLLAGFTGKGGLKLMVWTGRFLGSIPPMAWALALLVVLIQRGGIPVETLFPYNPPEAMDSILLRAGRHLWAWMLPVLTLAIPACVMMLSALAHRLEMLVSSEQFCHLRARGLGMVAILHCHFLPSLILDVARQGRATLPLLLGFSLPVEHIFGFDGLGGFSGQMLLTHEYMKALPAALYLGGWMLLLWFTLLGIVERRSPASRVMPAYPEGEARALICAIAGAVLVVALLVLPHWIGGEALVAAQRVWWREILFVLQVMVVACVVVLISMPLWQGWDRIKPKWNFGLVSPVFTEVAMLLPFLLMSALSWLDVPLAALGAGLVISFSGMALLRAQARELSTRRMVEASRMLGENIPGILKHHLLRFLLPSLGNWALRTMSALLLWMSIIHWFVSGPSEGTNLSWGAQMRLASEEVFDDPRGVMVPALMVALWCLSLQLLSRAFRAELPPQEIQPADPR
jgi:ABC-type dipeptide/oligopeptide/nickel transport system permease component/ABC-type dipeptide/oligopeptide/nickel transport system permease subunit